ncbi:MAG: FIST C-terminal domain-containing protein [Betaproteobacteria bacterium]|nr:FIST C-terminal domain-containing protein [Betaproteobacteria bacterium]
MEVDTLTHAAGIGWSHPLPRQLDGPQTLVVVFGAAEHGPHDAALVELRAALPGSVIAGCSTAGEIFGGGVHDDTLSVAIARFARTALRLALTPLADAADSRAAGARLASQLAAPGLRAVLLFSDGLQVNGTALVDGLTRQLPPAVAISGGLAGDGGRFRSTWVLSGAQCLTGHVCAVGLYGDALRVGLGTGGGWADFGPERRITRATGQVLYELDGKPALDLYRTYLGEFAAGLPATALRFPLSVREPGASDEPLVRTILAVDEAAHSLTFAGDIPQGGTARLMRANHLRLIDSAAAAGAAAIAGAHPGSASPALALSVSCVGRRMVLGEHTDEELESISAALPAGSGHVGFYSYGEISPAGGCESRLHNQTMTVTVLSESPA